MKLNHLFPPLMILISMSECLTTDMRKCICGVKNTDTTVVGMPSVTQSYPWLVAIRRKAAPPPHLHLPVGEQYYKFYTGTLVSDQFVVTAANVFDDEDDLTKSVEDATLFEAKPGALDWEATSSNFVRWRPIEEILIHPFFKNEMMEGRDLGYNVGLLKLKTKIIYLHEFSLSRFGIRPICLPTPNETPVYTKLENLVGQEVFNARAKEHFQILSLRVGKGRILHAQCRGRISGMTR